MTRRQGVSAVALSVLVAGGILEWASIVVGQRPAGAPVPGVSVSGQTTTRLADGRLLVLGGEGPSGPTWTVSLVDPATRQAVDLPARLIQARAGHTATLLPDGTVLIVGGRGTAGVLLPSAER